MTEKVMNTRRASASYLRSFIFGVEDSLVSTVGLLSGVAIAAVPPKTILLTGVVLIFVEAFSMAVGEFLAEESSEQYLERREGPPPRPASEQAPRPGAGQASRPGSGQVRQPLIAGSIMFTSYLVSGFVPLAPYVFMSVASAFWVSIALSLAALFVLGLIGARLAGTHLVKSGARMLVIGGIAIAVGIVAGKFIA